MISSDKPRNIPGYAIIRRDREQKRGKENNRGGGLLIGIKETTPYREIYNDLRGPDDEITEWITVEIPTSNSQKIRITNMYIPPIRDTPGEKARNRKTRG